MLDAKYEQIKLETIVLSLKYFKKNKESLSEQDQKCGELFDGALVKCTNSDNIIELQKNAKPFPKPILHEPILNTEVKR